MSTKPSAPLSIPSEEAGRVGSADARRHEWLVRCMDGHVRTELQSILLWTESMEAAVDSAEARGTRARTPDEFDRMLTDCARKLHRVKWEIRELMSLVDDALVLGRPGGDDGEAGWPQTIVIRDLLSAVLRVVEGERSRRGVVLECRTEPDGLHMVADPEQTVQAVIGLMRAAMRAARPGERILLVASKRTACGGKSGKTVDSESIVRFDLTVPRSPLGPAYDVESLVAGIPSKGVDARNAASAFALTVAARYGSFLGGTLELQEHGTGRGEATLSLCLPRGGDPERRPGWIP